MNIPALRAALQQIEDSLVDARQALGEHLLGEIEIIPGKPPHFIPADDETEKPK